MYSTKRPYLVIPKFIEQLTWGGNYIVQLKGWGKNSFLREKKIGQSYELFGNSKLATKIHDSNDPSFNPEFGFADKPETLTENFSLTAEKDFFTLADFVRENKEKVIGSRVAKKYDIMPILIKIDHAAGNSFQIHIKPGQTHPRWKPKPESWYYLEDGLITYGLNKTTDLSKYKETCRSIEQKMKQLSLQITTNTLSISDAREQAMNYIHKLNPWQFVNTHKVNKFEIVDLSLGGIHHTWEEDKKRFPNGNILYEIMLDVMDPIGTIRSFDQGRIKDDGSVRELHIDDYFAFIDTDPDHNDIEKMRPKKNGHRLLTTPYYCLDLLEINEIRTEVTNGSFNHLFVRDGSIEVTSTGGKVRLSLGHSCFLPADVRSYQIKPLQNKSVVIKSFIEI